MSETKTPQAPEGPPGKPESAVTLSEDPKLSLQGTAPTPFKLKLSQNGNDLAWLGQNLDGAPAYTSYCIAGPDGSTRILTPIPYQGQTYFQDQDDQYVSYGYGWNLLYMSHWHYAIAWEIRGNRFVRVQDGAVLTCRPLRNWPLAAPELYLSAETEGEYAVDVKVDNA